MNTLRETGNGPGLDDITVPETHEELTVFMTLLINEPALTRRNELAQHNPSAYASFANAEQTLLWLSRRNVTGALHEADRARAAGVLFMLKNGVPPGPHTPPLNAAVRGAIARTLEPAAV